MSLTPLVDQLEENQNAKELREGITAAKKWMTEESLGWIAKFPGVAKIVVHPIALMAYTESGRVAGYNAAVDKGKTHYQPKIAGLPTGVLPTIQRNQIVLVDMADNILCSVFLSMNPPTPAIEKKLITEIPQ